MIVETVLTLGYSFMYRGGEFLFRDGLGWDEEKVLRGKDAEVRPGRNSAGVEEMQLWVNQPGAKSDQLGRGTIMAHSAVPGNPMCSPQLD